MLPAHWSAWFTRLFCRWRAFYRQMMSQRVCAMRCCWSNSNRLVNLQLASTGGDYTILYTDKTHGQGHVKTPTISYRLVMSPWMCRPLSMGWMHGQRLILIYCELWNILWYIVILIVTDILWCSFQTEPTLVGWMRRCYLYSRWDHFWILVGILLVLEYIIQRISLGL